jgi:hypothetical protein
VNAPVAPYWTVMLDPRPIQELTPIRRGQTMMDERDTVITTVGGLKAALAAHEKEWVENDLEDFDDLPLIVGINLSDEAVILRSPRLSEAGEDGETFGIFGDWPTEPSAR